MIRSAFRRGSRLTLLLAVVLLMAGCWDRREVEDMGFVLALGLDKGESGGVRMTVQVANPRAIAGGTPSGGGEGGGGGPSALVDQIEQPTMAQAFRDLETFTSRRISLVHLKVVVIGRELAEEGVSPYVGILTRARELRRNVMMMVADGKAEEILRTKPVLERDPAGFLEDLTRRAYERTARAPRVNLHQFLVAYESLGQQAYLPLVHIHRSGYGLGQGYTEKGELRGTAIFRSDRLVGELSPVETETFLLLMGTAGSFIETVPIPGHLGLKATVDMQIEGREIKIDLSGPEPVFHVAVRAEGELREIQAAGANLVNLSGMRLLEDQLSEQLTAKANSLIWKLQSEYRADVVGLGINLRTRFLDWKSWEQYFWPAHFPKAKIRVEVRAHLRRVGMTFQPLQPLK